MTVGNLYGYGPVDVPMTEDLPLVAQTVKGRVRARMWLDALAAHEAGRVRAVEVRGSDYLCPGDQSMLGDRVMGPLLAGRRARVLGDLDQPHTWTSVPDVARLVAAVAQDERAWGRAWHVPSVAPRTQREVLADLGAQAGVPAGPASCREPRCAWPASVSPLVRALVEMLYEFDRPFVLDSTDAQRTFALDPDPVGGPGRGPRRRLPLTRALPPRSRASSGRGGSAGYSGLGSLSTRCDGRMS